VAAVAGEVAGVFGVGGGVDLRDGHGVQAGVYVDEGEGADVAEGGALAIAADAGDGGFDGDGRLAGEGYAADKVELVAHADGLVKVDAIDGDEEGAVAGDHLRTDVGVHVGAVGDVAAKDLLGDIFQLGIGALPAAGGKGRGEDDVLAGLLLGFVEGAEEGVFFDGGRGFGGGGVVAGALAAEAGAGGAGVVKLAAVFEAVEGDAVLFASFVVHAGHHGEVAGSDVDRGGAGRAGLFDADADLKRGSADEIDAGAEDHVAV